MLCRDLDFDRLPPALGAEVLLWLYRAVRRSHLGNFKKRPGPG